MDYPNEACVRFYDLQKFGLENKRVAVSDDMSLELNAKELLVNSLRNSTMSFHFDEFSGHYASVSIYILNILL